MKKFAVRLLYVISTLLVLIAFTYWVHNFLSVHHPVKSDIFLIEGWVSSYDVEETVKIINNNKSAQLYVIGKKYDIENQANSNLHLIKSVKPVILAANGSITLFPEKNIIDNQTDSINLILILKGSKARDVFSHVSVAINGSYKQSFFTNDKKEEYSLIFPPEEIEWISISFDNDLYTENEDRNLFLYDVLLCENKIDLFGENVIIEKSFSKKNTGFSSSADHMANYIFDIGIDKAKIHTISFNKAERNQTLNGAKAFKEVNDSLNISSFNVISSGLHSRRTWKTYQNLFNGNANVGVYYFTPVDLKETNWYKSPQGYKQLFEEFFAYLANLFYS